MSTFINIILNIVLPIFILIAIGYTAQRILVMDVRTFTKLNIYIFIPAIMFVKVYETDVTWQLFETIAVYLIVICVLMYITGDIVARLFHYPKSKRKAFVNSIIFFNGGNYGLPLAELAFQNNPVATTAQIFIMLIQNTMSSTFGVFQASSGNKNSAKALKNVLTMPSLYVLFVVILLKSYQFQLPQILMMPLRNIANGFIAVALITLGVQLAEVKASFRFEDVLVSSIIRLLIAPAVGAGIICLIGVEGLLAKSLILGVATPTAVNTAIIAKEFNNEPEYASQMVFVSTILSTLTVSGIIYLLEHF